MGLSRLKPFSRRRIGRSTLLIHIATFWWGNFAGVHHQHFFNFRLDMDVDGAANSVVEQNGEPTQASPANPYGNAFTMKETLLRKEQEAQRLIDLYSSRTWKVINPSQANALGQAVGYTLVGGENSLPFAQPDSWIRKRAGFVNAHVWVTPYDPAQMYAAGRVLERLKQERGMATRIVVDNGPEFLSRALDQWAYENGVEFHFIDPGKPIQNAYIESFNGKFRDACLNQNWFVGLADAQRLIETWRVDYNTARPHSSLGYQTPLEFAARLASPPRQSCPTTNCRAKGPCSKTRELR